jgi:hypothetical protein
MQNTKLAITLSALLITAACGGNSGPPVQTGSTNTTTDVGVPNITIEPCAFSFGEVTADSVQTATFTVSNAGTTDLDVTGIALTGPFTVNATVPVSIIPSNSYQFSIIFEPTTFDNFSEELTISSNDPDSPTLSCPVTAEVKADGDGDGFDSVDANGTDCDDEDPTIYPGAEEIWYDGVDQDCNGISDYDQDGDGYVSAAFIEDKKSGGGDCQDVDATIHPGAADVWYDGVDQDCDGHNDYDQDGDGYSSDDYSGTDCDDSEASVNPLGEETWNGADDDCDGFIDNDTDETSADILIDGSSSAESFGKSLTAGDFNGDGAVEIVVGASGYNSGEGRITLFTAADWNSASDSSDATTIIESGLANATFGASLVNLGDWDGDGIDDLAVGAPTNTFSGQKAGSIFIFSGPDLASGDVNNTVATLYGWANMQLGEGLSATDIDGDGLGDLISYSHDSVMPYNYMSIQYGGSLGNHSINNIDATWMLLCGTEPNNANPSGCGLGQTPMRGGTADFYNNGHAPADLDGDGYNDLLIADGYADPESRDEGALWALWGRSVRFDGVGLDFDATATQITGGTSRDEAMGRNATLAEDADGDNDAEIWLTSDGRGELYYVEGGPDLRYGAISVTADATANFDTGGDTEAVGNIINLGDHDGDGIGDIGLAYYKETDNKNGRLRILSNNGDWSGAYDFSTSYHIEVVGGDEGAHFSESAAVTPVDLNGDGKRDILIGDPDGGLSSYGRAFIFYNYSE